MLGKRFAKSVHLKSYHKNVWWKVNIFWPFHHPKCLEPYSYSQLSLINSWAYKPLSPNFWSIIFTGPISILSNGYICCHCSVVKSSPAFLQPHVLQPAMFLCPWDFPGKNTGVVCHSLLHGIFPTQESKLHLLH